MATFSAGCSCGQSQLKVELTAKEYDLKIYCEKCQQLMLHQYRDKKISTEIELDNDLQLSKQGLDIQNSSQNQFDHYTIVQKLGEGGMAAVYLALDNKTKEKVALKIFQKADNEKAVQYFGREIKILATLKHPNIVSLKNWGSCRGYPYYAMEYLQGKPLDSVMGNKPIQAVHAIQIMLYIIEALVYASQYQIIHRDIKPENILISNKGIVKLIDMGIGKIVEDSGAFELTKTGETMGTYYYMPLEQLTDTKRVDARADMYAIGATLYHMLCNNPPFYEYSEKFNKLIIAKMNNNYKRLSEYNLQLPQKAIEITEKAMGHKAEDRYKTLFAMKEEWMAVFRYLQSLPT